MALLVRLIGIATPPAHVDELLHLYAARSLLSDGTLAIFSGVYTRAQDFTWLAAAAMALFGDSLTSIRLPSAIGGAMLVAATYVWLRREAGRGPALFAALLLSLMAPVIDISQFARSYALQGLLFWIGAALLYQVVVGGQGRSATIFLGLLGLAGLVEALRLQVATMIGLVGFSAWAALYLTWRLRSQVSVITLVAVCAIALLVGGVLLQSGALLGPYETYRSASLWALPDRDKVLFYYYSMYKSYGLLLDLLPIAMLAAVVWHPRPALYCIAIFLVGMVLHSFGGMKAERYISYLLPFFACLWGLAAWPFFLWLRDRALVHLGAWASRRAASRLATAAVAGFCALVVAKAVPILEQVGRDLILPGYQRPQGETRDWAWRESQDVLRPVARRVSILIVDDDLIADYYVGRPDLVLSKSRLLENTPVAEFVRDYRTGIPTISSDESVRQVMSCFDSGLLVDNRVFFQWLPASTRAFIAEHTRALELTPPLLGFAWDSPQGTPAGDCDGLRRLVLTSQDQRRATP